jgi:hypothetical protein
MATLLVFTRFRDEASVALDAGPDCKCDHNTGNEIWAKFERHGVVTRN